MNIVQVCVCGLRFRGLGLQDEGVLGFRAYRAYYRV